MAAGPLLQRFFSINRDNIAPFFGLFTPIIQFAWTDPISIESFCNRILLAPVAFCFKRRDSFSLQVEYFNLASLPPLNLTIVV